MIFFCRYGKKNGYPVFEHVALPRVGAMETALKALSPKALCLNGNSVSAFTANGREFAMRIKYQKVKVNISRVLLILEPTCPKISPISCYLANSDFPHG